MGLISINLDIMSPKKRLFAVSAFFCLTPQNNRAPIGWPAVDRSPGQAWPRDQLYQTSWHHVPGTGEGLVRGPQDQVEANFCPWIGGEHQAIEQALRHNGCTEHHNG